MQMLTPSATTEALRGIMRSFEFAAPVVRPVVSLYRPPARNKRAPRSAVRGPQS